MTSVSSLGSALTQYQSPISSLDKNGDGIISADELAAANIFTGASTTATSTAKASSTSTDDDSGSTTDVVQRITADILNMMLQMQQQSDSGTSSDDSSDGTDAASGPQGVLASLDANGDGQLTTSEILSGDTQALAGNASGDDDDQFLTNILSDIQKSQQAYQNTYGSSPAADTADTQGEIQAI